MKPSGPSAAIEPSIRKTGWSTRGLEAEWENSLRQSGKLPARN